VAEAPETVVTILDDLEAKKIVAIWTMSPLKCRGPAPSSWGEGILSPFSLNSQSSGEPK